MIQMSSTDYQEDGFIGKGERVTVEILKHLTKLPVRTLKQFPQIGIYKQVPLRWIIFESDYDLLSDAHKKGSIDILIVTENDKSIAIRVQGPGHGEGLKGLGKVRHDKVQEDLIRKNNFLVDIVKRECPNIFKDRLNEKAENEVIASFKTAKVLIPLHSL